MIYSHLILQTEHPPSGAVSNRHSSSVYPISLLISSHVVYSDSSM